MTKKEAKKVANAIIATAARGAMKVYKDPNLREALEELEGVLRRRGSQLPKQNDLGGSQGQSAVLSAMSGCQKLLRRLSDQQRSAVFRGLHAWHFHDINGNGMGGGELDAEQL